MKRRQALRQLATLAAGLTTLPAWARKGWTPESIPGGPALFRPTDQQTLTAVIEAIIPESDIPGAVSLGVPAFVERVLADCFPATVQQNIEHGLQLLGEQAAAQSAQGFPSLTIPQRQALLLATEHAPDETLKSFFGLVKGLTIQGYTNTEYVQTTYLEYQMAPGYYHGCVPVKS